MKKVYSAVGVRLGTFIGGPITGGYLLSRNFKAIGRADLAGWALVLGAIITVAFLSVLVALPQEVVDKIPNVVFPLLFMYLAHRLFDRYQKEAVDRLVQTQEGSQVSNWRVVSISLLFALLTFALLFLCYFITDPAF